MVEMRGHTWRRLRMGAPVSFGDVVMLWPPSSLPLVMTKFIDIGINLRMHPICPTT